MTGKVGCSYTDYVDLENVVDRHNITLSLGSGISLHFFDISLYVAIS